MTAIDNRIAPQMERSQWIRTGLYTAAASVLAVLVVQFVAISIWPEIALFKPLDSYARSAVFTLVPVLGATALLAWLASRRPRPLQLFGRIAVVVLLLSIIPDYLLPVPDKTILASTVTAFLHVVAAGVTVSMLAAAYRRQTGLR